MKCAPQNCCLWLSPQYSAHIWEVIELSGLWPIQQIKSMTDSLVALESGRNEKAGPTQVKQVTECMPWESALSPSSTSIPRSPEEGNVTLMHLKSKAYFLMLLYHLSPHLLSVYH